MSVLTSTEFPNSSQEEEKVRSECPPSSDPLRKSVAKVCTNRAGNGLRIPVVDSTQQPLMPTTPRRARKMVEKGEATPFWSRGVFCVRLNKAPSGRSMQDVVVGIDPGSKREGVSVVAKHADFLNLHLEARNQVKDKLINRRELRSSRRSRNTPCRANRSNRGCLRNGGPPPSTKARWDWKLQTLQWIRRLYPVNTVVVEDIAAVTKPGQRKWNLSFSPLEVGKQYFYERVEGLAKLVLRKGYETKDPRDRYSLKKTSKKLSEVFDAHCVDSWVMAAGTLDLGRGPLNRDLLCVSPLDFRRRSLHLQVPAKNSKRRVHGGTRSAGWRKGTLVVSPKHGLTYLGGQNNNRVSLHDLETGNRLTRSAELATCKVLGYNSVRFHWVKGPINVGQSR